MISEYENENFYRQATDILTTYIKDNVNRRKIKADRIYFSRGTFQPSHIVTSLKILTLTRDRSKNNIIINLIDVDFSNINLAIPDDLDASYFNFNYSNFEHAFLSSFICNHASFAFASFGNEASIWNADFSNTNFHKADLAGSKWANVNFEGTNIQEAFNHGHVDLMRTPEGLTPSQEALFRAVPR